MIKEELLTRSSFIIRKKAEIKPIEPARVMPGREMSARRFIRSIHARLVTHRVRRANAGGVFFH